MKYLIGVDGGGTKTFANAYSLEGKKLSSSLEQFSNITVDFKQATINLTKAIKNAMIKNGQCIFIAIGIAGLVNEEGKKNLLKELKRTFKNIPIEIVNDAEFAARFAFGKNEGILTIAGTGSACVCIDKKNETKIIGGWGPILGDDGSAYNLVIDFIKNYLLDIESNKKPTKLQDQMISFFKIKHGRDIIKFVMSNPKSVVAKFAKNLSSSKQVNNLFKKQADLLTKDILRMISFLKLKKTKIFFVGGMFKNEIFKNQIIKNLKNKIELIDNQEEITKAVFYYYETKFKIRKR